MNAHTRKHTDKTYTHIAPAPRYKLTHREKMGRVSQKNWVFEVNWEWRTIGKAEQVGFKGFFWSPFFFSPSFTFYFFFLFFQCLSRLLTKRRVNAARIANVVLQLPEREWKEVVGLIVCL